MRSAGGTNSGELSLVTFDTKVTMDCFALPSFHDGSGSADCATVVVTAAAQRSAAAMTEDGYLILMISSRPSELNGKPSACRNTARTRRTGKSVIAV
jgi:hypothetical protein